MFPRTLDVGLEFDGFSMSGIFSLAGLNRMFANLVSRNAEARDAEEVPPALVVRIQCPNCGAPVYQLTCVERDGELRRACRCCRAEFSVGL